MISPLSSVVDKVICHKICWKLGVSSEDAIRGKIFDLNL